MTDNHRLTRPATAPDGVVEAAFRAGYDAADPDCDRTEDMENEAWLEYRQALASLPARQSEGEAERPDLDAAYDRFVSRLETGFAGCDPKFIFDAGFRAALNQDGEGHD